jgi:hypothetical protein
MTNFFKHKLRRKSAGGIIGWIILITVGVIAFAILFGLLIMWLWNWLMPDLFGLAPITYWQALGIFVLAKFLFGFGGSGGGSRHSSKNRKRGKCGPESKSEFSKWKYYDKFWNEEGNQAFKDYVARCQLREGSQDEQNLEQ